MAILAMCFDLMQEEIVAKFRWLGRKIGIVEKDEEVEDETSIHNDKNKPRSQTHSSINGDTQGPLATQRTLLDEDNDGSKQSSRKMSPRNNMTRIHPLNKETTNDVNLYQRNVPQKHN